jgi:hypothetical protein
MKKHDFLLIGSLLFAFIFTSYSPVVPYYGGKIQIKNVSSHNIYIVFQTVDDRERMLCVEKGEQVQIVHSDYRKELADPTNYYTRIALYDFNSGSLLKTLTGSAGVFELKSGSINSNNALFEFTINDASFGGDL